jgi:hypothetical protein
METTRERYGTRVRIRHCVDETQPRPGSMSFSVYALSIRPHDPPPVHPSTRSPIQPSTHPHARAQTPTPLSRRSGRGATGLRRYITPGEGDRSVDATRLRRYCC